MTDVVARAIGQRLSEKWGQQVVVENKGGGAHVVGAQQVANAAPDGHTLMLAEAGTFVINPNLYPKDKQPIDDRRRISSPITGLVRIHHSVMVAPKLPGEQRRRADRSSPSRSPARSPTAPPASAPAPHVNVVRFENMAKVKLNPFITAAPRRRMNDVMGGHTNMMMVSVSLALPAHRDGKVKMLSIGSAKRLPQLPEFPTTAEAGNLPGYIAGTWFGLAVTAGTPRPIVDKINADVRAVMAEPAFKEQFLERQFVETMDSSPEEFRNYIRAETQTWARVIREQNLVIGTQ